MDNIGWVNALIRSPCPHRKVKVTITTTFEVGIGYELESNALDTTTTNAAGQLFDPSLVCVGIPTVFAKVVICFFSVII
jgi:hypothetical protein